MKHQEDHKTSLFNRDVAEDYLRECTDRVAARKQGCETASKSIVIFRIGREWLALPTAVFQEAVDHCVVRTLPHRRGGVLAGMANVRGDLLLCVSLSALLGLERVTRETRGQQTSPGRLLICNRQGNRLAFRADEVYGVHRYHPKDLREVPATLAKGSARAYMAGVLLCLEKTVGCLNDELVFDAVNQVLA